jgi:hypothetical protein
VAAVQEELYLFLEDKKKPGQKAREGSKAFGAGW